jgi:RHS repeat-associated protein
VAPDWAYHNFGKGSPAYALDGATYGDARPDVAAARGARFLNSGYHFTVTGQPPGWYRFVVASRSTASTIWTTRTVDAYVDIPTVSLEINRSGTGTGSIVGTGLSCPGGSTTQAMPCGASYTLGSVVWITAVPDPGSTFAGWGGGCLGPQVTCGVTLNGDRYTFAYFTKTPDTVATTYYHTDAIGSVRALSDQTGATVIRHDYRPFGEDTQPLAGDPMRFAGKELDPESALMNFEARYYRNTWGRFTQVDPIAGSLADPQSWNRYAYARNNPMRFVDPTGLYHEEIIVVGHKTGGDGCNDIDGTWCPGGGGRLDVCGDILAADCGVLFNPPLRQRPDPIVISPRPQPKPDPNQAASPETGGAEVTCAPSSIQGLCDSGRS